MRDRSAPPTVPSNRVKIAVLHHNPITVPSDDIEAFDIIINAGYLKQSLANAGFDIVFHGHRHVQHCTEERLSTGRAGGPQHLHFISGDSIGCKEHAPFSEVSLCDTAKATSEELPACYFAVRSYRHSGGQYVRDSEPLRDGTLSTPLRQALECVAVNVGRNKLFSPRERLLQSINMLLPPLQQLQSKMVDWGEDSSAWVEKFHYRLNKYRRIYATDVYRRSSPESPAFSRYLRDQYRARLAALRTNDRRQLAYSAPVYRAIRRTGWKPDRLMWGDWQVVKEVRGDPQANLEIVRILVWPEAVSRNAATIGTLDFDHKFFAIPLFIIDPAQPTVRELTDFAIGFDSDGHVDKCYEFRDDRGTVVEEVDPRRGFALSEAFNRILDDPELKTVDEFLGYRVMIRDPRDLQRFAQNYDRERCASRKIVDFLRSNLRPNTTKVALDVGCGTGNYTLPFADEFGTIYGLDINDEMLAEAKQKSTKVLWMRANGLRTGLDSASCDAIWMISTLHYFEGESQKYLLREIHRVLRPGGTFVADTEFAEQHASLWLVQYFPSLRDRFRDSIFTTEQYETWLREIGFREFQFERMDYDASEGDAFLRIGQHQPELYLQQEKRDVIPAFKQMTVSELQAGLDALRRAIDDGSIREVMQQYQSRATLPGDVGFIVAHK